MLQFISYWIRRSLKIKKLGTWDWWRRKIKRCVEWLNWFNPKQREINKHRLYLSFSFKYKWPRVLFLSSTDLAYLHKTWRYKAYLYSTRRMTVYENHVIRPLIYFTYLIWNFIGMFLLLHLVYWLIFFFFYFNINWNFLKLISPDLFLEHTNTLRFHKFKEKYENQYSFYSFWDLNGKQFFTNIRWVFWGEYERWLKYFYSFTEQQYHLKYLKFNDIRGNFNRWQMYFVVNTHSVQNPIFVHDLKHREDLQQYFKNSTIGSPNTTIFNGSFVFVKNKEYLLDCLAWTKEMGYNGSDRYKWTDIIEKPDLVSIYEDWLKQYFKAKISRNDLRQSEFFFANNNQIINPNQVEFLKKVEGYKQILKNYPYNTFNDLTIGTKPFFYTQLLPNSFLWHMLVLKEFYCSNVANNNMEAYRAIPQMNELLDIYNDLQWDIKKKSIFKLKMLEKLYPDTEPSSFWFNDVVEQLPLSTQSMLQLFYALDFIKFLSETQGQSCIKEGIIDYNGDHFTYGTEFIKNKDIYGLNQESEVLLDKFFSPKSQCISNQFFSIFLDSSQKFDYFDRPLNPFLPKIFSSLMEDNWREMLLNLTTSNQKNLKLTGIFLETCLEALRNTADSGYFNLVEQVKNLNKDARNWNNIPTILDIMYYSNNPFFMDMSQLTTKIFNNTTLEQKMNSKFFWPNFQVNNFIMEKVYRLKNPKLNEISLHWGDGLLALNKSSTFNDVETDFPFTVVTPHWLPVDFSMLAQQPIHRVITGLYEQQIIYLTHFKYLQDNFGKTKDITDNILVTNNFLSIPIAKHFAITPTYEAIKSFNFYPVKLITPSVTLWSDFLINILQTELNYTIIFARALFFVGFILILLFCHVNLLKAHYLFVLCIMQLFILLFDILNINKYFYYYFFYYSFILFSNIYYFFMGSIFLDNDLVNLRFFSELKYLNLVNDFEFLKIYGIYFKLFFYFFYYGALLPGKFIAHDLLYLFFDYNITLWNQNTTEWFSGLSFIYGDSISYTLILLTVLIMILCLIYLYQRKKNLMKDFVEWMVYLSFLQLGLIGAFTAHDIFSFFIFFELTLIPIYLLMLRFGSKERKIRAAFLIVLYTFFGSVFLFFNILLIYGKLGTTNYEDLFYISNFFSLEMQVFLWCFFFIAFTVKIPTFPFHIWLPEAHVEAPTLGSVILAALMLKLGLYGIIKFNLLVLSNITDYVRYYVYFFSLISIFLSGFVSIRQTDIKKIIAYSSIGHMNLILLGLYTLTLETFEGCIFQLFNHGLISAGLFFCIGFLYDRYYTRSFSFYGGLVIICPLTAFFFFLFILSNISFPLTNSFIAEFLIYAGMYNKSDIIVYISSLNMILVAIYSMKLYSHIFFGNFNNRLLKTKDLTYREFFILFFLIFNILLTGIFSDIFMQLLHFDLIFYLEKMKLF